MHVAIQLAGRFNNLNNIDKSMLMKDIERFTEKHDKLVSNGELYLIMKQHKEKFRSIPLFQCRARFVSNIGRFNSIGHEYGIKQSVDEALSRIERQVDKTLARRYNFRGLQPRSIILNS